MGASLHCCYNAVAYTVPMRGCLVYNRTAAAAAAALPPPASFSRGLSLAVFLSRPPGAPLSPGHILVNRVVRESATLVPEVPREIPILAVICYLAFICDLPFAQAVPYLIHSFLMARGRGRSRSSVKKKRQSGVGGGGIHFTADGNIPLNAPDDAEDADDVGDNIDNNAQDGDPDHPGSAATNLRDLEEAPHPERRIRMCFPKRNNPHSRWSDPESDGSLPFEVPGNTKKRPGPGRPSKKSKNPLPRATPLSGFNDRLSYRLLGIAKEQPDAKLPVNTRSNIYGVAFNHFVGKAADIFATCGDTNITVYRCGRQLPGGFQAIVSYNVENEIFYSCDWSRDVKVENTSFLVAAGLTGNVRVLTIGPDGHRQDVLGAHAGPVNDVKVCPHNPELLATGSGDYSVRLWNLKTFILIAIFGGGGAEGPQNEVVSISFHDHYPLIAATGIDHSIHLWNYETANMVQALEKATNFNENIEHRYQFKPVVQHIPHWATRDIHSNYIDCISWWGDWIITRGVDQHIVMWRAGREGEALMELKYSFEQEHISSTESTDHSVGKEDDQPQPGTSSKSSKGKASKTTPSAKGSKTASSTKAVLSREEIYAAFRANLAAKASRVYFAPEPPPAGETTKAAAATTTASKTTNRSRATTTSKVPINVGASTSKAPVNVGATTSKVPVNIGASTSKAPVNVGASTSKGGTPAKSSSKKASCAASTSKKKSTTTTTTIIEKATNHQQSDDDDDDEVEDLDKKNMIRKKVIKANIGPDVRISRRFPIDNSRSWYMRFGLDFDHRLLGFGNETGDYYLFDLGSKDDLPSGWEFKKVTEFKIPSHSIVKNNYVRQVAFNYTGQLMVSVTDQSYVILYRIKKKVATTTTTPPPIGSEDKGDDATGGEQQTAGTSTSRLSSTAMPPPPTNGLSIGRPPSIRQPSSTASSSSAQSTQPSAQPSGQPQPPSSPSPESESPSVDPPPPPSPPSTNL